MNACAGFDIGPNLLQVLLLAVSILGSVFGTYHFTKTMYQVPK